LDTYTGLYAKKEGQPVWLTSESADNKAVLSNSFSSENSFIPRYLLALRNPL
jgi:hypothetical protein